MTWEKGTFDGKEEVIADMVPRASTAIRLKPRREIVGDVVIDSWFFGAKELIFKKGARLIFSSAALAKRNELFVVADTITIEDGVGTVMFQEATPPAQGERGQAATGAGGKHPGDSGANGEDGLEGITGLTGQNSPDITMFIGSLAGQGNLEILARGGTGGEGGRGQRGGDGGAGVQGTPAQQDYRDAGWPIGKVWLPACAAGPGQGGNGGSGGKGGQGGRGGVGGNGGTVTIAAEMTKHEILTKAISVSVDGGTGGKGGAGGPGGIGGAKGLEGQLATFCNSAGREGAPGPEGGTGLIGLDGGPGRFGPQFVVAVDSDALKDWFNFE